MLVSSEFRLCRLPPEIRLKIWNFALSIPRNVHVFIQYRSVTSFNEPPALLGVCCESRLEALKIYKPFLNNFLNEPTSNIYVALSQDTIVTSEAFTRMWITDLKKIQKMKIEINLTSKFLSQCISTLKNMPDLRELELVFEQGMIYKDFRIVWTVTDYIQNQITQGWDYCPEITIVDGQEKEKTIRLTAEGSQVS